jgi:hypothetical protein
VEEGDDNGMNGDGLTIRGSFAEENSKRALFLAFYASACKTKIGAWIHLPIHGWHQGENGSLGKHLSLHLE